MPPTPSKPEDQQPGHRAGRRAASPRAAADALNQTGAPQALAGGIRTSLRENATAYGFSISVTAAYGLVSAKQPATNITVAVLLFAAAAALAFIIIEVGASKMFTQVGSGEHTRVAFISGAIDGFSVLCAVGAATALSSIPGLIAWPATSAGTVLVFLVVGGLDVLIARLVARRTGDGRE